MHLRAVISPHSPSTMANKRKVSPVGGYTGVVLSAAEMSVVPPQLGCRDPPTAPAPHHCHRGRSEPSTAGRAEPNEA